MKGTDVIPSPQVAKPIWVAEQFREEPQGGPSYITAPDSQYNVLSLIGVARNDLPDTIRQSEWWAAGDKVKPEARQWINSHLAIGAKLAVMDPEFKIGKLIGYLKAQTYVGGQLPSVYRVNIHEAVPTTLGSMYEVSPSVLPSHSDYDGFDLTGQDGYPY